MKRRALTVVEVLVFLAVLGILATLPYYSIIQPRRQRIQCQENLRQIRAAMVLYTQDWSQHLPPAALNPPGSSTHPFGWADAIRPYAKTVGTFHCPAETRHDAGAKPWEAGYTDYYFNQQAEHYPVGELNNPANTILSGEGNDGSTSTTARYAKHHVPDSWKMMAGSPLARHLEGSNYVFVDGHVKWIRQAARAPVMECIGNDFSFCP